MRWTLAWCLVAAAILLVGGSGSRHRPVKAERTLSPRMLRMTGAACVAVGAVAVGGFAVGAVAAIVLAPLAAAVLGRIAERPARANPDASLALALDLAAVALRSGRTVASALVLAAPTLTGHVADEWRRVAGLLALGADPDQAWGSMADDRILSPVAVTARRSADSGARLARAFSQLAVETRASLRAAAVARANRAGVFAMAPLGLCFLPAFVCLGIVPTVAGIAGDVLGRGP
jgi:pilus assembly protein TadC